MSSSIRRKKVGNKDVLTITYKGHFLLPACVQNHPDYIGLSHVAARLLFDIGAQFNGSNNGDLQCSQSVMKSRGWTSNSTREKALKELIEANLIIQTKQGGRGIGPNLYAITWQPIHECKGKHDLKPTLKAIRSFKEVA